MQQQTVGFISSTQYYHLFSYNASAQLFPSLASTKLSSFDICNVATIFLKYFILQSKVLHYTWLHQTNVYPCSNLQRLQFQDYSFSFVRAVAEIHVCSYLLPPPKNRVTKILKNNTKSVWNQEGVPVKLVQCSVKHMVQKQLRNEAFFF
jgi:hypothetical protein